MRAEKESIAMDSDTNEAGTNARRIKIDLRDMTPDEVVAILQENGFHDVSHALEPGWGEVSIFNLHPTQADRDQVVRRIAIQGVEAPLLTVVVHDGSEHTLEPGHDLHYFEQCGDRLAGWGWARTSYLYR